MTPWTIRQKSFSVETHFKTKLYQTVKVICMFPEKFNCCIYPIKGLNLRCLQKFMRMGLLRNTMLKEILSYILGDKWFQEQRRTPTESGISESQSEKVATLVQPTA